MLRLWNINQDALNKVFEELQQRLGPAMDSQTHRARGPALFAEILSEGTVFPLGLTEKEAVERRIGEEVDPFLEGEWIHRPQNAISIFPPIDAAGHAGLRKKLIGVVQFLGECAAMGHYPCDMERLRRKLGLTEVKAAAGTAPGAAVDISALGAAELASLTVEQLSDAQTEEAYQTALRLDARELAGRFAAALVKRPPRAERPDRFPWFTHLIQLSLSQNNTDAALDHVNEGEKQDCEHNEGRRRNDYELRRGQIHVRRG